MKSKKDLEFLAEKIIEAEKKIKLGENKKENQERIKNIAFSLSPIELLDLDEIIMSKIKINY